jgi:uncharacterized membrane protein
MSVNDPGSMQRAKQPRSPLAGAYGHPVHPILVTIPIGAWTSSIVLDIVAFTSDDPAGLALASAWLLGIGAVGAVLAAIWGAIDLSTLAAGTAARRTGITHAVLNVSALVVFLVDLAVRRSQGLDDVGTLPFVLSLVGIALVGASGFLGGRLAYHYGVRVADEATQAEGFRPPGTAGGGRTAGRA